MFPITKLNAKTNTGLELVLKCVGFSGIEAVNSTEPILRFKYAVCEQSLEPFRNIENPSMEDYIYKELNEGSKDYSNQTLRQDIEIINGIPTPQFEQDGVTPKMIGNIDFWLKFGGDGIIADLYFTLSQIKQEPLETFYKS